MPATPITTSSRFFMPEVSKCIWIPTIAATPKIPTRAEINAGTDLSREIADIEGFSVTSESIDTQDMGSKFTGSIPGRRSAEDSNITFYGDEAGNDVRTVLVRGTNGYVYWADGGDVSGRKGDIYPVRVSSAPKQRSVGDEAFRIQIQFDVTSEPVENFTIPA